MTRARIHVVVQVVLTVLVVAAGWHYATAHVPEATRANLTRLAAGQLLLWTGKRIHPLTRIAACCASCFPAVLSLVWLAGRAVSAALPIA